MSEQVFNIGIKGLIRNRKGQFLVLSMSPERLRDKRFDLWDLPGGRMDLGETFQDALAREIKEELGFEYDVKPEFICSTLTKITIPTERGDVALVLMFYLLTIPDDAEIVLSKEHTGYEWVDLEVAVDRLKNRYQEDFAEQVMKSITVRHHKKLVRDNIPDIIRAEGKKPITRILKNNDEYQKELLNKLAEEMREFSLDYSLEELADIQEVVHALRESIGKSHEELEQARTKKNNKNGSFKKKIYLEGVK